MYVFRDFPKRFSANGYAAYLYQGRGMIIDGHAHACGEYFSPGAVAGTLNSVGADKVVLCPGDAGSTKSYYLPDIASYFPLTNLIYLTNRAIKMAVLLSGKAGHLDDGNESVYRIRLSLPDRILQCYWIDPRKTDCLRSLDQKFNDWHFAMAKLHQCWTPFNPNDALIESIAEWCGNKGLPIFIHIHKRADIGGFSALCRRHPQTIFILGHLFGAVEMMHPSLSANNAYFDISPPQLVGGGLIMSAVKEYGAYKLIMGSDTPYGRGNLRKTIDRMASLPLTPNERELVMGGNLMRLLRLSDG